MWFEYICYPNNVCILLHCRRSLQSRLRVLTSQQQHPLRRLPRWCVLYVGHLYQCYYLIITLCCKHGRQVRYDYIHFIIKWSPLVYCIVNELLRLVTCIYHACMNQHSCACIYIAAWWADIDPLLAGQISLHNALAAGVGLWNGAILEVFTLMVYVLIIIIYRHDSRCFHY